MISIVPMRKPTLIDTPEDDNSDHDEPLLSGSGKVSKDCTVSQLQGWEEVLNKWRHDLSKRPKQLSSLVKKGIPESLRGEVWQLLANCQEDDSLMEKYRLLISQESPFDIFIRKDTSRTFPAHEYFKESCSGQDSLYRLCKAYSIFDKEIGYCQGLSFLTAALLLHMPEEQAFCLLVKIMHQYAVRNLFQNGFEDLRMRFYQLERLIEEQLPELHQHFSKLGVEAHMYASQWFLTLFTAKFPLYVVYHILDLFLLQGMETIFQVAASLLFLSKKELLALDFEGVLKYFRVNLPKKYRVKENANTLIQTAVTIKVKKLSKYEKDYLAKKAEMVDPKQLKLEKIKLLEHNIRLEQESDDLARDLLKSKIEFRGKLDQLEDKIDIISKELMASKKLYIDLEEEKKRLEEENTQLKEVCRRELVRADSEIKTQTKIITEYKVICSQTSARLEKKEKIFEKMMRDLTDKSCPSCNAIFETIIQEQGKPEDEKEKNDDKTDNRNQIRELEIELASTKLALVEAECLNQELAHKLAAASAEIQASKNTWLNKTLTSIREVAKKEFKDKDGKDGISKQNSKESL